ncbi:hypothetical protein Tco_0633385 [Tanacetum coccineum]
MTAPSSSSTNDANNACSQVSAASPSVNTVSPQVCTASVSDNTVYAFMVENPNGSNVLHQDLKQINEDDLEAMDLKWQLSLLSVRAKKYYQKTGKKIFINGNDIAGYDKSKVECYNCHSWDTCRECRAQEARKKNKIKQTWAKWLFSDSEVYTDKTYSKTCLKNYETLKKQYDDLLAKLHQTEFKASTYKRGLDTVEATLGFEKVKQEKEGIDFKIEKFENASKDLDKLLGSQITDNSKKGLGYHAIPPPHPLIYNAPTKLDLSYSRLDEFKEPEFEGYGLRANKSVCEISSNETKKNSDAPLIKEWVSDNEDEVESLVVVEKKIVVPTIPKVDVVRPNNKKNQLGKYFDHLQYTCKQKRQLNGQREEKPVWNNARNSFHLILPDKVILMLFVVVAQDKLILLDQRQWLMLLGRIGLMLLKHQHVGFGDLSNLIVLIHFDGDMITVVQEGRSKFEMAWVPKQERLGYKAAVKLHDQFDDEKRAGAELTQQNDKWGGGGVNSTEINYQEESFTHKEEMAPMALSDSEVKTCSKTCLKNHETLKKQYDDLRTEFNKSQSNLADYKRGLASVKERLVFYKKNEVMFCEQIDVLKRDITYKDSDISVLKCELEKLKKEKESNKLKLDKFENASKSLDKLIGSQISDNSRKGVGFVSYNVVPPPPTGLFAPPKIDLSNSGLEEFQEPEFEGYGPKTSKSASEDISNEVRKSNDAPLVEKLVSDDKSEKKIVFPTVAKIEFVKSKQQEKPVRKPVKYAEMYSFDHLQYTCKQKRQLNGQREEKTVWNNARRVNHQNSPRITHPNPKRYIVPRKILTRSGPISLNIARQSHFNAVRTNWVNAVKALACWVWRPIKPNNASITLKRYDYFDLRGRSRSVMAWVPKKV